MLFYKFHLTNGIFNLSFVNNLDMIQTLNTYKPASTKCTTTTTTPMGMHYSEVRL